MCVFKPSFCVFEVSAIKYFQVGEGLEISDTLNLFGFRATHRLNQRTTVVILQLPLSRFCNTVNIFAFF